MTSDAPPLSIRSEEDVQITIYDAAGLKQLVGTHRVVAPMPRGLYRVHLDRCGFVAEHLIRHDSSEDRTFDGPLLESPAPIEIARASHVHAQLARQLSGKDQTTSLPLGNGLHDTRLFVFVRRVNHSADTGLVPSEPLSIHDVTGRQLVVLAADNSTHGGDPETGYLAFSCQVDPGTYRLRVGRVRRDLAITIPEGRAAHVFLADHGFVSLRSARVYLPRVDHTFDPGDDIARAMESVLWALGQPRGGLPRIARGLLPAADRDLSFGIACAHLARRLQDRAAFDEIMRTLTEHAPELPDVVILEHTWDGPRRTVLPPAGFASPPLFRASLGRVLEHRLQVASRTALAQAAKARHDDSVWCTWSPRWWDERWIEPTIERLRSRRDSSPATIEDIASSTRLPVDIVQLALERLDAGLPWVDERKLSIEQLSIPGYRLGGVAGRGVRSIVFRARRDEDGREVAVKVVPISRPELRHRALGEIGKVRHLHHKRLIRFDSWGILPDYSVLWLEMELCSESLFDRLAALDRPMPASEACSLVLQVLEALEYLHAHGTIHGNINPGSLLVRGDASIALGPPKLGGNNDSVKSDIAAETGDVMRFMAPECVINPKAMSRASDVWSMAATLYFLLTLELPRERYADQTELEAATHNDVISLLRHMKELPISLVTCIEKALALEVGTRFRNGKEFAEALLEVFPANRPPQQANAPIGESIHPALPETIYTNRPVEQASTRRGESIRATTPASKKQITPPMVTRLTSGMKRGEIAGHALVVGSPGENLRGVEHDVQAMTEMLQERRFLVDVRTGERATRAGILEGYDDLIAKVRPDEPVVFYYSGHGFHAVVDNEQGRSWQGISPTDLNSSTTTDFRGITAWELSIKQAQLTERTKNVTVILDCCYASQMSRDGATRGAVPRALAHPVRLGFDAHLRALRETYGAALGIVGPLANRDVVQLVACGQDESAFEYRTADGNYRGAFTEAILEVLHEVGDTPVSWAPIGDAVRARVLGRFAVQRPNIEGPTRRRLFSLDEEDTGDAVAITATPDGFRLAAGHLLGILVGDVYGVMPPGSRTYRATDVIAQVQISTVSATLANAELRSWKNGHRSLPEGALAILVEKAAVRRPVRIDAPEAERAAMEQEVVAIRTLRVAGPYDATVLAVLRLSDDVLTIEDQLGPLFPTTRFPEQLKDTVKNLANLGAAQGLRELEGEHGLHVNEIDIEWGTVDRRQMRRMPDHGGALALRDKLYVRIKRTGHRELYAHVFNVGIRGKITLLTGFAPTGVALTSKGADFVLGQRSDGALLGLGLGWPEDMPRDTFPRIDEIVVIVTSARASLRNLETIEQLATVRSAGSKLEDLLAQLQDGLNRNMRGTELIDGFFVKRLSYFLHPLEAVMADISFKVDDNPLRKVTARSPDAWIAPRWGSRPPLIRRGMIAIEISNLVVENALAIFSDIRVDALICTRSTSESGGYVAWTRQCRGVQDGERLILEKALVFHGSVYDFVDIYFWLSRDTEHHLPLSRLLAHRAASPDLQDAARALAIGEGIMATPRAAATGASAVFARTAYELLLGVAGASIGLYRTSFLAGERFGVGSHTVEGLQGAARISLSLSIEQVALGGTRNTERGAASLEANIASKSREVRRRHRGAREVRGRIRTAIFTVTATRLTIGTSEVLYFVEMGREDQPISLIPGVNALQVGAGVFKVRSRHQVDVTADIQEFHVMSTSNEYDDRWPDPPKMWNLKLDPAAIHRFFARGRSTIAGR